MSTGHGKGDEDRDRRATSLHPKVSLWTDEQLYPIDQAAKETDVDVEHAGQAHNQAKKDAAGKRDK